MDVHPRETGFQPSGSGEGFFPPETTVGRSPPGTRTGTPNLVTADGYGTEVRPTKESTPRCGSTPPDGPIAKPVLSAHLRRKSDPQPEPPVPATRGSGRCADHHDRGGESFFPPSRPPGTSEGGGTAPGGARGPAEPGSRIRSPCAQRSGAQGGKTIFGKPPLTTHPPEIPRDPSAERWGRRTGDRHRVSGARDPRGRGNGPKNGGAAGPWFSFIYKKMELTFNLFVYFVIFFSCGCS